MEQFNYKVNLDALRGKIIEKYKSVTNFSEVFGCSYTHMLDLLNGRTCWSLANAYKATALLDLSDDEKLRIFFYPAN